MLDEHDEIDRQIDAAARGMTNADPRADFTIRVMRRIAAAGAPRSSAPPWLWVPALAAAAILLIVLVVQRRHAAAPEISAPAVAAGHAQPAVKPNVATPGPVVRTADRNPRAVVRARNATVSGEAPLAVDVEPLSVEPMRVQALDPLNTAPPDAIGIEKLTVAPLNIEGEK